MWCVTLLSGKTSLMNVILGREARIADFGEGNPEVALGEFDVLSQLSRRPKFIALGIGLPCAGLVFHAAGASWS